MKNKKTPFIPLKEKLKEVLNNAKVTLTAFLEKSFDWILLKIIYPVIFFYFFLFFIFLNILVIYLVIFIFIPLTINTIMQVINPVLLDIKIFQALKVNLNIDFTQLLVATISIIAAYIGWLKYIGNKKIEQFNNLSERASKNEDDLAKINAITTLPIFSRQNPDNIFNRFILLNKIKEFYLFLRDLAISPQKNNRVLNILSENHKKFIKKYLPILDEYLGHVAENKDPEVIRDEYIKDYNHDYPYVEESINILKNILMLEVENKKKNKQNSSQIDYSIVEEPETNEENNQEKKENGFTPVETAVSEALTKITKHSFNENHKISVINFDNCNLKNIKLNRVNLHGASFMNTIMNGIDLKNCYLMYAYLNNAYLQGAELQDAKLQGAYLKWAYLEGANLQWANLQEAYLEGAKLQGADLRRAYLQNAKLRGADLQDAKLQVAYLKGADLRWASLEWAKLQWADLSWARLEKAYLQWAHLQEADLRRANLVGITLDNVITNNETSWDDCFIDNETYNKYKEIFNKHHKYKYISYSELDKDKKEYYKKRFEKLSINLTDCGILRRIDEP